MLDKTKIFMLLAVSTMGFIVLAILAENVLTSRLFCALSIVMGSMLMKFASEQHRSPAPAKKAKEAERQVPEYAHSTY